jgi:dephospho-CoA kinase
MIVIGLTGSIGTGKSTVTKQFAECGAATLDSDKVVHNLLAHGGAAVEKVAELFPVAHENGSINRRRLGTEVFGNKTKLTMLEAIIHPLVRQVQDNFIRMARLRGKKIVVLDIPLLFETKGEERCHFTVVTHAPAFIQKQRVLKRPNMTEEKLAHILAAQMSTHEKRRRSDFTVNTGLGKHESLRQVQRILLRIYVKAARVSP